MQQKKNFCWPRASSARRAQRVGVGAASAGCDRRVVYALGVRPSVGRGGASGVGVRAGGSRPTGRGARAPSRNASSSSATV